MSYHETATSSVRQDWETPQEFFDVVDAEFGFTLDVCALPETAKCKRFFTPNENGLAQKWSGMCWMNPPYGQSIPKWISKAYQEACAGDATVVCLVPARMGPRWFHEFAPAAEIRLLKGRLQFVGADTAAPFDAMLMIFHAHLDPGGIMRLWDWKARLYPSPQMTMGRDPSGVISSDAL